MRKEQKKTHYDKWDYLRMISSRSFKEGDVYGFNGILKLLNETDKSNTRELTLEEVKAFWERIK